MIRVGIAGIGFMGWIHYLAYQKVRGIKLVAVSEPNPKRLSGDWRDIKGNFGPPGERVDLSGIQTYTDYHDLIADPNVDLVDFCLPPAMHAEATVAALRAGKHVFCEKPMALTTADCRRMVAASQKAKRHLFVGHVLPFFPEYAKALSIIRSGKHGRLIGGSFKRVISDPLWLKDFYDPQRVGGPLLDLHVHDAHLIRLLFGMPSSVISRGRTRGEVVEYCNSFFEFPSTDVIVSAVSGVINQQGREFTHGFEIQLEQATLHYELAVLKDQVEVMPLKVLNDKGKVVRPKMAPGDPADAFVDEIKEVVQALREDRASTVLSGDLARDAIVLCHKQSESVQKGRAVKIG